MCALCSKFDRSFRWITYLVSVTGAYTFLHWFLAVPLLYYHLNDCCSRNYSENWIAWFLAISFACWLGVCIIIALIWLCLKLCRERRLNESNVRLTGKPNALSEDNTEKAVHFEKNAADILLRSSEAIKESAREVIALPNIKPSDSMAVLKVNETEPQESPVSPVSFPIPVDESRHYVQSESSPSSEKDVSETPLKTPREIFFKDLIEAASKSYFNFDPEEISRDLKKKYELEKIKEGEGKQSEEENEFFVGPHSRKENLKSEVAVTLDEKGLIMEAPVAVGQFQILKD